mgnify:FL=1
MNIESMCVFQKRAELTTYKVSITIRGVYLYRENGAGRGQTKILRTLTSSSLQWWTKLVNICLTTGKNMMISELKENCLLFYFVEQHL